MQISVWEQESFYSPRDIIIAGAGLAGLWCAYELKKRHPLLTILILEKGPVPLGASTRNAGFACFGSPSEILEDINRLGEEAVLKIVEMRYKGIHKTLAILGAGMIDYDDCGGYECIDSTSPIFQDLTDKIHWLNLALREITGSDQTFRDAGTKLLDFNLRGFDALIGNELEGGIHSGRLVAALTAKVRELGVDILTGFDISGWEETTRGLRIRTTQEVAFSAGKLLLCTNAFSRSLLPDFPVQPGRGQILLTAPVPGLSLSGTFHYDQGYYYFRNIGNRILLGGARNKDFQTEETLETGISGLIQHDLENFLYRHLTEIPGIPIENRWSGIMGFTPDKKPLLTTVSPGVTALIVCNGMGVALSPIMAEYAASLVSG